MTSKIEQPTRDADLVPFQPATFQSLTKGEKLFRAPKVAARRALDDNKDNPHLLRGELEHATVVYVNADQRTVGITVGTTSYRMAASADWLVDEYGHMLVRGLASES